MARYSLLVLKVPLNTNHPTIPTARLIAVHYLTTPAVYRYCNFREAVAYSCLVSSEQVILKAVIRLRFDCDSTIVPIIVLHALRPFDDRRNDRAAALRSLNEEITWLWLADYVSDLNDFR